MTCFRIEDLIWNSGLYRLVLSSTILLFSSFLGIDIDGRHQTIDFLTLILSSDRVHKKTQYLWGLHRKNTELIKCFVCEEKSAVIISTYSSLWMILLVIRVLGRACNSSVLPHKYHSRRISLFSHPTYIFLKTNNIRTSW